MSDLSEPPSPLTGAEKSIRFRCTLCSWCCQVYTPLITGEDAKRIQDTVRKPLASFLVFYRPEDFTVPLGQDERIFITKEGPLAMGLVRKDEACIFLKGDLCDIHPFKPGICRAFPFEPEEPGNLEGPFVMMEGACHGKNAEDQLVEQREARDACEGFLRDYYQYVEMVGTWNATPVSQNKDIEDFLRYVGLDWWRHYQDPGDSTISSNAEKRGGDITHDHQARSSQARRS